MTNQPVVAFGLDIAGFSGKNNTGLAALFRWGESEVHAWVLEKENVLFGEKHERHEELHFLEKEKEELLRMMKVGNVFVDTLLDIQAVEKPTEANWVWQLQQRPVDYAYDGLDIYSDLIGAVFSRMRGLLMAMEPIPPELRERLWETYPKASLTELKLPSKESYSENYKYGETYKPVRMRIQQRAAVTQEKCDFEKKIKGSTEPNKVRELKNELRLREKELRAIEIFDRLNLQLPDQTNGQECTDQTLDDDQLDAIICALPGVIDGQHRLEGGELANKIREKISEKLHLPNYPGHVDPPKRYVLIHESSASELPRTVVHKVEKTQFEEMLNRSQDERQGDQFREMIEDPSPDGTA